MIPKGKILDPLSNSLNHFCEKIDEDQCGEFVCGYWDLKNEELFYEDVILANCICQFDLLQSLVVSGCMFHKEGTLFS